MQVHHGEDENPAWLDGVNHAVGEAMREAESDFAFQDGPRPGMDGDTADGRINLEGKIEAEVGLTAFIVLDGLPEFRFLVEREIFFSKRSRTFAKTASPEIASALPERNSSSRRWAVVAHFASMPGSGS